METTCQDPLNQPGLRVLVTAQDPARRNALAAALEESAVPFTASSPSDGAGAVRYDGPDLTVLLWADGVEPTDVAARLVSLVRTEHRADTLRVGALALDLEAHTATLEDRPLHLTGPEFRLLRLLARRTGTTVPATDLIREAWGHDQSDPSSRPLLRAAIQRLRRKLGDDPADPRLLHTVPGVGLVLVSDPP